MDERVKEKDALASETITTTTTPVLPETKAVTSIMSNILSSDSVYMPEGWNIKDILRSNSSAISEQLSSYSNLGRSLIGSIIGFDDMNYDNYDVDRDMDYKNRGWKLILVIYVRELPVHLIILKLKAVI